jgi:hypothetical protein
MAFIYSKWPKNMPNISIPRPPKFTQIGIFGFKIYHLATPLQTVANPLSQAFAIEGNNGLLF